MYIYLLLLVGIPLGIYLIWIDRATPGISLITVTFVLIFQQYWARKRAEQKKDNDR